MRRVSILIAVLSITVSTNAAILISVDGVTNPPDTQVVQAPDETLSIGIWGDGTSPFGTYFIALTENSPGMLDPGNMIPPQPPWPQPMEIVEPPFPFPGFKAPMIEFDFIDAGPGTPPLSGQLVDNITLRWDGYGDPVIILMDIDGMVMDTQVVHALPEPGTIVLLGLGAMLLKRRR